MNLSSPESRQYGPGSTISIRHTTKPRPKEIRSCIRGHASKNTGFPIQVCWPIESIFCASGSGRQKILGGHYYRGWYEVCFFLCLRFPTGEVKTWHLTISGASPTLWHHLSLSELPGQLTGGHWAGSISFTHVADIIFWHDPNSSCSHLHLCWFVHGQKSISVKKKKSHAQSNREKIIRRFPKALTFQSSW